jgi:sugar phosphate permease
MTAPATLRRFHRVRLTVFIILAVSFMSVFFHRIAPAVVAGELMQAFATSGAALGSLAAMYYYVYTAMQIPAGVLADTLGVRLVAGTGALVAGLGSIVFGLAPDFFIASLGRFLVGLGVSVVFVGMMRANAVWWSEARYGFIGGLTVMLGNLGAILAAGPLALVLATVSWRTVFVVAGVLSLAIGALTFLFVRNRPEDAGFPSLREREGKPAHAPRTQHWWRDLMAVLKNPAIWPGFWVNLGMGGSLLALAGLWGVPLLRDVHGLTRAEASLYTTTTLAALAVGALALGSLSDHIRRRKPVLVAAACVGAIGWLGFALLPWGPGWSGFLLYGLLGFCTGGFVVTYGSAKEVVAPAVAGMALALVNTGLFLGAAIVQPLFGALLDLTWDGRILDGIRVYRASDYANGLWLCFGLTLLAALASLRARETHCRNLSIPSRP